MAYDLIDMEIIEAEFLERYKRKEYMTRDFFIGDKHYNWTHNMDIGDGGVARYGVLQGWPIQEGAKQITQTTKDRAAIVEQSEVSLVSALTGESGGGLYSPLAHNPGGVARRIDPKPTLDDLR